MDGDGVINGVGVGVFDAVYVALLLGLGDVDGDPLDEEEDDIDGVDDGLLETDGEPVEEDVIVDVIDGEFVADVVGEILDVLEILGVLVTVVLEEPLEETDCDTLLLYEGDPVLEAVFEDDVVEETL